MSSRRLASAAAAVAALVAVLAPASASAHGDLASDALLSSNVSLPDEANVPPAQQAELVALTKQAAAHPAALAALALVTMRLRRR